MVRSIGRPFSGTSHLRFPPLLILSAPELHGRGVVEDVAVGRVAGECAADAVGDGAEVAEQGALVADLDLGVGRRAGADGGEEVGQVDGVAAAAALLFDELVLAVEDGPLVAGQDHRRLVAVEGDAETVALEAARQATVAFPGEPLVAEIEGGDQRVGRFLVVLEEVAAAAGGDALRVIDLQAPAGQVEHVDAVVADLAGAPVPEPVPVVMEDVA